MTLLSKHIKAARIWLEWDQRELAQRAAVSLPTVQRMEASDGSVRGNYETVEKVRRALEAAGIEFIEENGGGPGVRLKKGHDPSAS